MNELQALTLCRDAVQRSKGVDAGLWFDGPDRHCTIGAISQVAVDIGFPLQIAKVMTARLQQAIPLHTKNEIVDFTDGIQNTSRANRRRLVLDWLNNKISKLTEHTVSIADSPKELMAHVAARVERTEATEVPVPATR